MSRLGVLAEGEGFGLSVPRRGLAKPELLSFAGGKGLKAALASVWKDVGPALHDAHECDLLAQCSEAPERW